jgi:hypothetical protein
MKSLHDHIQENLNENAEESIVVKEQYTAPYDGYFIMI